VVIDIVLPAMLGLVLVREPGVKASSDELEGLGLTISFRHDCVRELERRVIDLVGLSIGGDD